MKISKVFLHNFRQFYGSCEMEFSLDKASNITIVHAENGGGKTTLLNAMKWCLYGTTDFDTGNDNLLNEHCAYITAVGDIVKMTVSIDFEHEGKKYSVFREQSYKKNDDNNIEEAGGCPPTVTWIDENGESKTAHNPENHINQILPKNMHSYFFFNGERIEKLAYASSVHEIQTAIRTLMGLEIIERGRDHLSSGVRKHFMNEAKKGASKELEDVISEEEACLAEIDDLNKKIKDSENNQSEYKKEIKHLEAKLRDNKDAAEDQAKKDEYQLNLDRVKLSLKEVEEAKKSILSSKGFLGFLGSAATEVREALDARRQKGELPYKIKGQFIDDLLSSARCICGTEIKEGTEEYDKLRQYSSAAQSQGLEEAFNDTFSKLKFVPDDRKDMFQEMNGLLKRRKRLNEERQQWSEKIDEVVSRLKGAEEFDVHNTQKLIDDYERKKDDAMKSAAVAGDRLKAAEVKLKEIQAKNERLSKASSQAELANKRLNIVHESIRVIEELYEALSLSTKDHLSKRVNDTFQKILNKDYWVEIDDEYRLTVFKKNAGGEQLPVYEKSTGESQVTSLSFIAGLISLARDKSEDSGNFFRGGIYPIVMDSPYGSLDAGYRTLIARYIPQLAEQVIVFASSTQWRGELQQECNSRVGKHISLIYHAPKVERESAYSIADSEYEYTTVEEGYHD